MKGNIKSPVQYKIDVTLWVNCTSDSGNKYSQLTIEETPLKLYKLIPVKEVKHVTLPHYVVVVKEIVLNFKGKKYIIQFSHTKKYVQPVQPMVEKVFA